MTIPKGSDIMHISERTINQNASKIIEKVLNLASSYESDDKIQLIIRKSPDLGIIYYNMSIDLQKTNYKLKKFEQLIKLNYAIPEDDIDLYSKVLYTRFVENFQVNTFGFYNDISCQQVSLGCSFEKYHLPDDKLLVQFYTANISPDNFVDTNGKKHVNLYRVSSNNKMLQKYLYSKIN